MIKTSNFWLTSGVHKYKNQFNHMENQMTTQTDQKVTLWDLIDKNDQKVTLLDFWLANPSIPEKNSSTTSLDKKT